MRKSLAENLLALREAAGLTQEQLAKLSGVKQGAVSKYETGVTKPEVPTLLRLAVGLGVSVERLVKGIDATYDLACQTSVEDGAEPHPSGGRVDPAQTRLLGEITRAYEKLTAEVQAIHGELGNIVARAKTDPIGREARLAAPKPADRGRRRGTSR